MDVLPSDLATYGRDAKALLKELQSQNERMFLVTFLVLNTGKTEQELETNVFQAVSIAQKHNCELCRLDFQQEQGLMSSLPLADCQIEIQRGLTTSSTAIFVPFTTQELFDNGKESLYYGLNALSNNLIMVDRKKLKNPNGLILGTPGSGKSFSAKARKFAMLFSSRMTIFLCAILSRSMLHWWNVCMGRSSTSALPAPSISTPWTSTQTIPRKIIRWL